MNTKTSKTIYVTGKKTLMIFLIIFGIDAIIVGGSMIAVDIHVKRELKIRNRINVLKQKRIDKRLERWSEADRIIESIKIESE
jgi:hypothetical protein